MVGRSATERFVHPTTKTPLTSADSGLVSEAGDVVSTYDAAGNRFDWITAVGYDDTIESLKSEIRKYDAWAGKRLSAATVPGDGPPPGWAIDEDPLYRDDGYLHQVQASLAELLNGARVLDVGGSCMDAWRFLLAGVRSIDHVEPSAVSQALGLERVIQHTGWERDAVLERMTFHTGVCEFLPFRDCAFDVVFSRASIHHTRRAYAIPELRRVLADGGVLLCIEPIQTRLVNRVMHISRKVRRVDRGSDDPLTERDLGLLATHFREVRVAPDRMALRSIRAGAGWLVGRKGRPYVIRAVA